MTISILDASIANTPTDGNMWRVNVQNSEAQSSLQMYLRVLGSQHPMFHAPWRLDASRQSTAWLVGPGHGETVNLARSTKQSFPWLWWRRKPVKLDMFATEIGPEDNYSFQCDFEQALLLYLDVEEPETKRVLATAQLRLRYASRNRPVVDVLEYAAL